MSTDIVLSEKHKAAALEGTIQNAVYIVRWMEHEYEPGWGVDDNESHLEIYKTPQEAHADVEEYFKDKPRSLYGAGRYFMYPSGPNDSYNMFQVFLAPDHKVFEILKDHDCIIIPRIPNADKDRQLRQEIILQMQDPMTRVAAVPFIGLNPKPVTSEPISAFPAQFSPASPRLQEQLPPQQPAP